MDSLFSNLKILEYYNTNANAFGNFEHNVFSR